MFTLVVIYFEAKVLQFFGMLTPVLEAVQDYPDPGLGKCLDLVEDINYTSIIGRVGNVEGNNMQILCRHVKPVDPNLV